MLTIVTQYDIMPSQKVFRLAGARSKERSHLVVSTAPKRTHITHNRRQTHSWELNLSALPLMALHLQNLHILEMPIPALPTLDPRKGPRALVPRQHAFAAVHFHTCEAESSSPAPSGAKEPRHSSCRIAIRDKQSWLLPTTFHSRVTELTARLETIVHLHRPSTDEWRTSPPSLLRRRHCLPPGCRRHMRDPASHSSLSSA